MQPVRIAAGDGARALLDYLQKELIRTDNQGEAFTINQEYDDGLIAVECNKKERVRENNALVEQLSPVLADYLMTAYEGMLLNRVAKRNYGYLRPDERREIIVIAQKKLEEKDQNFFDTVIRVRRRNLVTRKVADYLNQSNHIILEGFVTFRMQEYVKELEEIMDWAVRQYLVEKEYQEFIKLLTCFVQMQKPKFQCVHVFAENDFSFSIYDESMERISDKMFSEWTDEEDEGIIREEDLLISFLISAAPRQVIIHNAIGIQNKELLETITQVFSGRVTVFQE